MRQCAGARRPRKSFQSSPNPKVGCHPRQPRRCQHCRCFNPHPTRRLGAIQSLVLDECCLQCFNPHPTRRLGAIGPLRSICVRSSMFQSSPNPKVGCHKTLAARPPDIVCFNPHPTRRLGAILSCSVIRKTQRSFNPHPTRRLGAM